LEVLGLTGGHSGGDIHKNRANALKLLGRVLWAARAARVDFHVASLAGGSKHNAIPREAEAAVFVPARAWDEALNAVAAFAAAAKGEVATVDPGLTVTLTKVDGRKGKVLKKAQLARLLRTVSALPHGVTKMSADIPGLVETSTNVAVVATERGTLRVVTSQRSSVASEIDEIAHTVKSIFELAGAKVEQGDGYPGWKPNLESPILKLAKRTYQELYGKEPEVKAIHAGLECGIIGERMHGMDMLSFGPTMEGVHSPDERLHIDTVERFWSFLLAILKKVS
jgi:dipeptidase D